MYRADGVEWSPEADEKVSIYEAAGYGNVSNLPEPVVGRRARARSVTQFVRMRFVTRHIGAPAVMGDTECIAVWPTACRDAFCANHSHRPPARVYCL